MSTTFLTYLFAANVPLHIFSQFEALLASKAKEKAKEQEKLAAKRLEEETRIKQEKETKLAVSNGRDVTLMWAGSTFILRSDSHGTVTETKGSGGRGEASAAAIEET